MKALVLEEPGRFRMTEVKSPERPGPGQALVRVHRVGICGTDLHAYEGRQTFFEYPRILGHELGVEIVGLEDTESKLAVGDRCAVEPYLNCGQCIACRRGKSNCCVHLTVLGVHVDGGMQDWLLVPREKLHQSKTLSLEQLALVEPLCVGAHAVRRAGLEPGEVALVIGAGPIGLSVIESARAAGAGIIVAEISEKRLEFCRQRLRLERCVNASGDPRPRIQEILSGELPTAVFDCTGNPRSMMASFNFVAHGGKLIFVGHFPGYISFHDPDFHRRELTLLSSRNATAAEFQRVIRAMEEGRIDTRPWVTQRFSPSALVEAFPGLLNPETGLLKPVVEW